MTDLTNRQKIERMYQLIARIGVELNSILGAIETKETDTSTPEYKDTINQITLQLATLSKQLAVVNLQAAKTYKDIHNLWLKYLVDTDS